MSQINIMNLTFAYDGSYHNIFENVSFQIDTDWKLGFCGRNGRGKTTFLNLLLGKYEYKGSISSHENFEYFPYDVGDETQNTFEALNNIFDFPLWKLKKEFINMEIKEDVLYRPFNTLSKGEQTKSLLCALFLKENSFLLIDEPTNHLDMNARQVVSSYLSSKKGFILVSHDRVFLDNCTNHTLSINKTNIEIFRGNFSTWQQNKDMFDNFEAEQNQKLKKEIKRLEHSAKQTAQWSKQAEKDKYSKKHSEVSPDKGFIGARAARVMSKSKNIEARQQKNIEEKSKLFKNTESTQPLKLSPVAYHKECLVSLKDISIFYDGVCACKNISFQINKGDIIALQGKNGCGKSSILKLILEEQMEFTGEFYKGTNLIVSYVPQSADFLHGSLKEYSFDVEENLFKAILRKLDFSRDHFEINMEDLSQGQKKKVLIAKSLCEKAHLYVWDEPLNYIDVLSRMQIENLLLEYTPTLIFVEHDKAFCSNISNHKIIVK